jgi:hypothetical protein
METFYIIVITVAIICLILTLTVIGIILSSQKTDVVFPPTKNTCPDYWTAEDNGGDTTKNLCIPNAINVGAYNDKDNLLVQLKTSGYGDGASVNFGDSDWATNYNTTSECALKSWANKNEISWDGVSNYNGCK